MEHSCISLIVKNRNKIKVMKLGKIFSVMSLGLVFSSQAFAQQTYQEIEQLTVNESVTTVITASEPIRFVDISDRKSVV